MPAADAQKAALRQRIGAARRERTPEQIAAARAAVRAAVLHRRAEAGWACVAAYVPLRTEPGSVALLEELAAAGVRVLVPVLLPDRDLDWQEWPEGPLLGVEEVRTADAVLVPALAVDRAGIRLGRGGGSYDRVLARLDAAAPIAALLFDGEVLSEVPREPWDRPVTAVVTPGGWQDVRP